MLALPPSVRILFATAPTDMRRSFDGLAMLVREVLREDPFSGHLFVFRSRSGDRMKLLYWDGGGLCLFYKRLEKGTFAFPHVDGSSAVIEAGQLALLLEGIDFEKIDRPARFVPKRSSP